MKEESKREQRCVSRRSYTVSVAFAVGGFVLYLLMSAVFSRAGPVSADGKILRDGYGGEERQYQVFVNGLDAEMQELPLTVTVSPRQYTDEEASRVFESIMERMEEKIRGENPSLMEVSADLTLPTWMEEEGIRLRWYSSDPEIVNAVGEVNVSEAVRQKAQQGQSGEQHLQAVQDVVLYVQLSDGVHKADYEIPIRIVEPEKSGSQQLLDDLSTVVSQQDEAQQASEYLSLPLSYEGKPLSYRTEDESDYVLLPVLGILLALIWPAREQAERRKKEKQREKELLLDYADLVSKLMVLIGAGMTVRNAWMRMVADYENGLQKGTMKYRHVYEEMRQTGYQMQSGLPESRAYREFGRRCRLQPYLKLSGLLEQNLKSGNKNLRAILETELADAFEQRKNLARRLGEEAGTRLLFPLFLMLGIVMVMIMVPAMMTMG